MPWRFTAANKQASDRDSPNHASAEFPLKMDPFSPLSNFACRRGRSVRPSVRLSVSQLFWRRRVGGGGGERKLSLCFTVSGAKGKRERERDGKWDPPSSLVLLEGTIERIFRAEGGKADLREQGPEVIFRPSMIESR